MSEILVLSFVTASISFAVAETKAFRPLREWMRARNAFVGDLFSCGYCLGHWVAFSLVAIYQPRLLPGWWLLDYVLTALVIAWLGGIQWIVMCLMMQKAAR